jgi:hypothetical protein
MNIELLVTAVRISKRHCMLRIVQLIGTAAVRRRYGCLLLGTPSIPVEQGLVVDVPYLVLDLCRCFWSLIWCTSNETLSFLNADEDDSLTVAAFWILV